MVLPRTALAVRFRLGTHSADSPTCMGERNYSAVIASLYPSGDRTRDMQAVVDALWIEMAPKGCSWIGFYLKNPDGDELILGPRRDKPACSPIALFGACGQSFQSRKPLIVTDVSNLRAGYIACDPRDRSEVVIPCMDAYDDLCWGVLDADSHDIRSFDDSDVVGLTKVLIHMKLHVAQSGLVDQV
jgi:putative methionine-R-sulfoxide reductase with GAF domain